MTLSAYRIGLVQCELLRLLGIRTKERLNDDLNRSGQTAAAATGDLDALSLKLLDIESQVSSALESDTNVIELVDVLHLNSAALDAIAMLAADEVKIQPKSVEFVGK